MFEVGDIVKNKTTTNNSFYYGIILHIQFIKAGSSHKDILTIKWLNSRDNRLSKTYRVDAQHWWEKVE